MNNKLSAAVIALILIAVAVPSTLSDASVLPDDPADVYGASSHDGGKVSYTAIREYGSEKVETDSGRILFRNVDMDDYVTCKVFDGSGRLIQTTENLPAFGIPFAIAVDLEPGTYTVSLIGVDHAGERQWLLEVKDTYKVHFTDDDSDLAVVAVDSGDSLDLPRLTHLMSLSDDTATFTPFAHWSLDGEGEALVEPFSPVWNTQLFAVWDDVVIYQVEYTSTFAL